MFTTPNIIFTRKDNNNPTPQNCMVHGSSIDLISIIHMRSIHMFFYLKKIEKDQEDSSIIQILLNDWLF